MLADFPIHPVLLAKDLDAARDFYHSKLGLPILTERGDHAIVFACGDGTQLAVSRSTTGTLDMQTQVAWTVDDLDATLAELRERGVQIEEYDEPGLKTEGGIAEVGFGRMAWMIDPGGNALGILEERS